MPGSLLLDKENLYSYKEYKASGNSGIAIETFTGNQKQRNINGYVMERGVPTYKFKTPKGYSMAEIQQIIKTPRSGNIMRVVGTQEDAGTYTPQGPIKQEGANFLPPTDPFYLDPMDLEEEELLRRLNEVQQDEPQVEYIQPNVDQDMRRAPYEYDYDGENDGFFGPEDVQTVFNNQKVYDTNDYTSTLPDKSTDAISYAIPGQSTTEPDSQYESSQYENGPYAFTPENGMIPYEENGATADLFNQIYNEYLLAQMIQEHHEAVSQDNIRPLPLTDPIPKPALPKDIFPDLKSDDKQYINIAEDYKKGIKNVTKIKLQTYLEQMKKEMKMKNQLGRKRKNLATAQSSKLYKPPDSYPLLPTPSPTDSGSSSGGSLPSYKSNVTQAPSYKSPMSSRSSKSKKSSLSSKSTKTSKASSRRTSKNSTSSSNSSKSSKSSKLRTPPPHYMFAVSSQERQSALRRRREIEQAERDRRAREERDGYVTEDKGKRRRTKKKE